MSTNYKAFHTFLQNETKLIFKQEYVFCDTRKWRFDYANIENKIAVELEGGVFSRGRHVRPIGFKNDVEKYNTATVLGWKVIRVTTDNLTAGVEFVKKITT